MAGGGSNNTVYDIGIPDIYISVNYDNASYTTPACFFVFVVIFFIIVLKNIPGNHRVIPVFEEL